MSQPADFVLEAPDNPDHSIWHYMDFTKFVSMLENGGLFFSRADKLGDPFEGSLTLMNRGIREYSSPTMVNDPSQEAVFQFTPEQLALYLEKMKEESEFNKRYRPWIMINCWHMNLHESAAMWKVYSQSTESIAIVSTYRRLAHCLHHTEAIHIGKVRYIDYEHDLIVEGDILRRYFHKRKSFEYEHELRAVYMDLPATADSQPPEWGHWHKTDLNQLVQVIYVSPLAATWFKTLVQQVALRYGLQQAEVRQSSLINDPFLF